MNRLSILPIKITRNKTGRRYAAQRIGSIRIATGYQVHGRHFYAQTAGTGIVQVNLTDHVRVRDVYSFDFNRRISINEKQGKRTDPVRFARVKNTVKKFFLLTRHIKIRSVYRYVPESGTLRVKPLHTKPSEWSTENKVAGNEKIMHDWITPQGKMPEILILPRSQYPAFVFPLHHKIRPLLSHTISIT
jgi:hypothetical protein